MVARLRLLVVGTVALAMVLALPALAQDRDDLAQARARIDALATQLDEAVAQADGAQLELADAEQRLAEIETVVNQVAQRVEDQHQAVRDAEGELASVEADQVRAQGIVRQRAIQLYKSGSPGGVLDLLASADIQSAIQRAELLSLLDADDQAILETLVRSAGRIDAARATLAAEAAVLDDLLGEQREIMATAEELRDSRALAAASATTQVDELTEDHDQAAHEAARLEEVIRAAEAEAAARAAAARAAAAQAAARADAQRAADDARSGTSSLGSSSSGSSSPGNSSSGASSPATAEPATEPPPVSSGGGYRWPACGSVTSEFGWRWGRPHKGLDIDDNFSSTIYAAQSGTVISAGWNSGGYGNLTLIKHGDGAVTAYAHQSAIHVSTGQSVGRGQVIGIIGTTGSSTGTHLHFEIRLGGGAVNPRNFLSGGC